MESRDCLLLRNQVRANIGKTPHLDDRFAGDQSREPRDLLNSQFLVLKWRFGQFIWIHLPLNELSHPLLSFVMVQHTTAGIHFDPVEKDRHRLPKNARIFEEKLIAAIATVVGAKFSGNEGFRKPTDGVSGVDADLHSDL